MNHFKITTLLIATVLLTTPIAAQFSQGAGIQQKVTIGVNRAEDKTTSEKVELYCLQQNLSFCDNNPGTLDILLVMLDMEQQGEKWFGHQPQQQEDRKQETVQTIGNPTSQS